MKIRKAIVCLVISIMVIGLTFQTAIAAESDLADIEAIVGTALEITWDSSAPLAFGTFLAGNGGTVVITPQGTVSVTGGVYHLGGASGAAKFNVSGTPNMVFNISLPTSVEITRIDGQDTMVVDNFTSDPVAMGSLDAAGSAVIDVGATLNVAQNQAPGEYSGTFTVIVNYE